MAAMLVPNNKAFLISFTCLFNQHGRCVFVIANQQYINLLIERCTYSAVMYDLCSICSIKDCKKVNQSIKEKERKEGRTEEKEGKVRMNESSNSFNK